MTNEANIYSKKSTSGNISNPTLEFSDHKRANLGICFSGGGSRALTCAWGQLLALKTLELDTKARYISSVSGGTWASSIYTYLPQTISDDDLLGEYHPPSSLSLTDGKSTFNINTLGTHSLGKAPQGMGLAALAAWGGFFLYWYKKENYQWLWASIVSKFVLEPYDLNAEDDEPWVSKNSFSLSLSYANDYFPPKAPPKDNFFFTRPGRPFLIMNDNIMETVTTGTTNNIIQLPNQATPVSAGALGQTPDGKIIGGGSVESYGYNSTLDQNNASISPVKMTINKPYSLIDSASTSSAFFAETLARYFNDIILDEKQRSELSKKIESKLKPHQRKNLLEKIEGDIVDDIENTLKELAEKNDFDPADFIPTYNYWPIADKSENALTQYTDGGTLENTGILGLLAQTDTGTNNQEPIYLVIFDNTSTPLEKKQGKIIAGEQAAPLFGINFDSESGSYAPFTADQRDPQSSEFEATSLIQIFDNSSKPNGQAPFDELVNGLYATNCGAQIGQLPDETKINTAPAFCQMTLTTISNSLANITAGRTVHILYIQNAKMLNWQNQIEDKNLQQAIEDGQKPSAGKFSDFKDFPYYSTFFKIGLEPKESNALSQMCAWALMDSNNQLNSALKRFMVVTK